MQRHKEYFPSFGIDGPQTPVCRLTVLAPGGSGRDCAAYEGIVPAHSERLADLWDGLAGEVRSGGSKISEERARALFDLGELEYRR